MDADNIESILYGNGTMALPWALGNDDRQVKKGTKSYRIIIAADIEDLCAGVCRMLVHPDVFPVPRSALDVPRGSTLLLGFMKMYCMQLGDFRDFLVNQQTKFQFRVPDLDETIDQPTRQSVRRRINLSFSTLEAHGSEFGEMNFEEFQRIHETGEGDGAGEVEATPSPAAVQLDFVSLFDAQLREQRRERRRTRNTRGGFVEELPDDDLIAMLRSNQNIVADMSSITLTEADAYVQPPQPQRLDEEFGGFGDEEMAGGRPSIVPEVAALPGDEAGIPMDVQETSTVDPVPANVGLETQPSNPEEVPEGTTSGSIRAPSAKRVTFVENPRSEDAAHDERAKRKRSKKSDTPAGFMQDEELVLPASKLREMRSAPIPTYEELLQRAISLRNIEPRLSARAKNEQIRRSIYYSQGRPLGKTLQDFVDQIHEPERRHLLRPKSTRNRNSTVPVQPAPPDLIQDEFDRNVDILADSHRTEPRQSVVTEIQTPASAQEATTNISSPSAALTSGQITFNTPGTTVGEVTTNDNCTTHGTTLGLGTTPGTTTGVTAVGDERGTIGTFRGTSTTPMATSDVQATFGLPQTPTRVEATGLESHENLENPFVMEPAADEIAVDNVTAEGAPVSQENLPYKTFRELFPPETTSRQKAAFEFQRLLKLQVEKKVLLIQHEFCGEIWIKPLD